jgi:hypothetical protein
MLVQGIGTGLDLIKVVFPVMQAEGCSGPESIAVTLRRM